MQGVVVVVAFQGREERLSFVHYHVHYCLHHSGAIKKCFLYINTSPASWRLKQTSSDMYARNGLGGGAGCEQAV
jgi:hypothetical protein